MRLHKDAYMLIVPWHYKVPAVVLAVEMIIREKASAIKTRFKFLIVVAMTVIHDAHTLTYLYPCNKLTY